MIGRRLLNRQFTLSELAIYTALLAANIAATRWVLRAVREANPDVGLLRAIEGGGIGYVAAALLVLLGAQLGGGLAVVLSDRRHARIGAAVGAAFTLHFGIGAIVTAVILWRQVRAKTHVARFEKKDKSQV